MCWQTDPLDSIVSWNFFTLVCGWRNGHCRWIRKETQTDEFIVACCQELVNLFRDQAACLFTRCDPQAYQYCLCHCCCFPAPCSPCGICGRWNRILPLKGLKWHSLTMNEFLFYRDNPVHFILFFMLSSWPMKSWIAQSHSGVTTGGSGGSCLRAPARRGRLAASIEKK